MSRPAVRGDGARFACFDLGDSIQVYELGDKGAARIFYEYDLTPKGARFVLFAAVDVPADYVAAAIANLRAGRDVVGAIEVRRVKQTDWRALYPELFETGGTEK